MLFPFKQIPNSRSSFATFQSLCCYQTLLILINSGEMKPIKCDGSQPGMECGREPLCDCLLCNKRRWDAKQAAGHSCRLSQRCDTPRVHAWLQPNSGSVMWTNHIIVTKEPNLFAPNRADSFLLVIHSISLVQREKSYFLRSSSWGARSLCAPP
jgi:hypothetical protein